MNVFLSYAAEQRELAERIALELRAQGESVYFDKDDVREGELVHTVVRDQIERSDFFIFLMSPDSLQPGRYPLAELSLAKRKWKNPVNHVLPVLAAHIPSKEWPAYLRALSALRSHIDIGADPVADICRIVKQRSKRTRYVDSLRRGGAVLALAALIGVTVYFTGQQRQASAPPSGSPEFEIRGDNAIGAWGKTVTLGLRETRPGSVDDYGCRVDWRRGGNIRDVSYDRRCASIEVAITDEPVAIVRDRPANILENLGLSAETVRIVVVDSSGRDVWQRDATVRLNNMKTR